MAPKVEYTAPVVRPSAASLPRYELVPTPSLRGEVGYTPPLHTAQTMRPVSQITTHVPPAATRPAVELTAPAAPAAPKIAEATVSEGAATSSKVFDPTSKSFYDKVATLGDIKLYREKDTKFWYTKDRAGCRSHASSWKLYEERNGKLIKTAEISSDGRVINKTPSNILIEIKVKDLVLQGGGK